MPRGRKRRLDPMGCPDPFAGLHVKANGTRRGPTGLRRIYRCTPTGETRHAFGFTASRLS